MLITSSIKFNLMMTSTLIIIKVKKMCYLMMDEWHSSTGGLPGVVTGALDFDGLGRLQLRTWRFTELLRDMVLFVAFFFVHFPSDPEGCKRGVGFEFREEERRRKTWGDANAEGTRFLGSWTQPPFPPTRAGAVLESRLGITCGVPVPTNATNS